jgi:hypothetical protein
LAQANLVPNDWKIIEFYLFVSDQMINLTPAAAEKPFLAPRLEAWLAACEVLDIPKEQRAWLIDKARLIHRIVEGREKITGLWEIDPAELAPPT